MDMVFVIVTGVIVVACLGMAGAAVWSMGRAMQAQAAMLRRFVDAWVTPEQDQAERIGHDRPVESSPVREQTDPRRQYRYEVRPPGEPAHSVYEDFPTLTGTGGGMGA